MGWMLWVCFSKISNCDAASKHNMDGGTWPRTMCRHISKKKSKPFAKSSRIKQFLKRSYTILERLLHERHGEFAKMEISAS